MKTENKLSVFAPTGLLKLLILEYVSAKPLSGSEILNKISKESNGLWIPSPGSIYPIIKTLSKNGLLLEIYNTDKNVKKYVTTSKGKSFLVLEKSNLNNSLKRILTVSILLANLTDYKISKKIENVLNSMS